MTDLKFKLLESFYKGGRFKDFTEIYKLNLGESGAVFNALQELKALQFITITPNFTAAYLTPMGANAYEEAKENREKQSQNKKQQRFDNKIAIASVFISLISFVTGVVVETNLDVWSWFLSLFQ